MNFTRKGIWTIFVLFCVVESLVFGWWAGFLSFGVIFILDSITTGD